MRQRRDPPVAPVAHAQQPGRIARIALHRDPFRQPLLHRTLLVLLSISVGLVLYLLWTEVDTVELELDVAVTAGDLVGLPEHVLSRVKVTVDLQNFSWIQTEDADGTMRDFDVEYTTTDKTDLGDVEIPCPGTSSPGPVVDFAPFLTGGARTGTVKFDGWTEAESRPRRPWRS